MWSWDALRYRGSGWWLDAALPRSPLGLIAVALLVPATWFGVGLSLADDRDAYLATPDVLGQLWFFPLHVVSMRVVGGLWGACLGPALDGLGLDPSVQRRIRAGALGGWATLGALAAASYFIVRDTWFGLTPDPDNGLLPFDDPDMWDMAALGRRVHVMMLGLWALEWLMFGYLLWLQIWILIAWTRAIGATDFRPRLQTVLVRDGYRHAFVLFSQTTSVCLVFALGNLGFIYYTGELIPREVVEIHGVGDFLREMSDLLSTSLLFLLTLIAVYLFVRVLRRGLTRAVDALFKAAGDRALVELETPIEPDVQQLTERVNAQAGLLRAVAFQREVDTIGGGTMLAMIAKALVPLATAALKMRKVLGL